MQLTHILVEKVEGIVLKKGLHHREGTFLTSYHQIGHIVLIWEDVPFES